MVYADDLTQQSRTLLADAPDTLLIMLNRLCVLCTFKMPHH